MSIRNRLIVVIAVITIGIAAVIVARPALLQWLRQAPSAEAQPASQTPSASSTPTAPPRVDVPLDPRRRQLIGVRTARVARASGSSSIRTLGVVRAAETRLTDVNVKVEGWIRELYADYTGQPVTKGQPLFSLYSPDLLAWQREFVLAMKGRDQLRGSTQPDAIQRSESLVASSRRRLQLWDLPPEQIARLEQALEPESTVTFHSPVSGFVLDKSAVAGLHVTPGQTLYRLADLGVVWIEADAYEHDLPVIRVGAKSRVVLDAYPNEGYSARVLFIAPSLQPETRTAKVRFEVPNIKDRLKPGMYVNVEIATTAPPALVVPVDAVLDSGTEQVVFVAQGDGSFAPRHVQIGARRRDAIEITSGLHEGDEIATSAAFFLDSESQLRAGVSGYEASAPASTGSSAAQLTIALHVQPDPPKTGENTFEVTVKDASGQPIADAQVAVQFFMPAMPTMNMPAMRNTLALTAVGGGLYRGTGEILMAGRWETTVTVTRSGQRLGALQTTTVAK
jgi:RND family efflux transporter MFP subunit